MTRHRRLSIWRGWPEKILIDLLRSADVTLLVDIRTGPGSRRYPWFGRDLMAEWLPEAGIAYQWAQDPSRGGGADGEDDGHGVPVQHA